MKTATNFEMQLVVEETKHHRMAKLLDFLEMWQGSQNVCSTQKVSGTRNKPMTVIRYISDTEGIVKGSWRIFQDDCAAAFIFAERSPLPPGFSIKALHGGHTQVIYILQVKRINRHSVESDENTAPAHNSDIGIWEYWNTDLDYPNEIEDNPEINNQSNRDLGNGLKDPECSEQQKVSTALSCYRLIWAIQWSKKTAAMVFISVNAMETSRNTWNQNK